MAVKLSQIQKLEDLDQLITKVNMSIMIAITELVKMVLAMM
jgi:hypothetical protein